MRQYSAKKPSFSDTFDSKRVKTSSKISQGAFGTVYLAEDLVTSMLTSIPKEKKYAVKKFYVTEQNKAKAQ